MRILDKILLAQDFAKSSEGVLMTAIEIAKIFDSSIIPIHVLPDDIDNEKVYTLLKETAHMKLKETCSKIDAQGVEAGEPILAFGSPHTGIVEASIRINANLILTGSGALVSNDGFQLGTTAERIIQKSEKPVYVVEDGTPLNVQHILCPVDMSPTSRQALKNAITMARRFKAELTILSVCELQGAGWFSSKEEQDKENERIFTNHKEKFEQFLSEMNLSGLQWNREVKRGNPSEEILGTISAQMVDLLVMGTVGRTGISRLIMGSVTEKVVRKVPCSFVTIKSEDVIQLQVESNIRDIENHYNNAMQLMEDGFYDEAINQFKLCLTINSMHAPAYFGIAKVFAKLDDTEKARKYRKNGQEILDRIWYYKIEDEVRKLKSF